MHKSNILNILDEIFEKIKEVQSANAEAGNLNESSRENQNNSNDKIKQTKCWSGNI